MATRKKTSRKKTSKKKTSRSATSSALLRVERELPASLREYTKQVRARLTKLESRVEKARAQASRRGTRLLREASEYLGRLEARGEREWRKATTPYRRDAVKLLRRLERAIAPPARTTKAATRKTAGKKKRVSKKK